MVAHDCNLSYWEAYVERWQLEDIPRQKTYLKNKLSTCHPSYLGGRDQVDHGSKPAQGKNSLQDPISKISNTKKGWPSGSSGTVSVYQV
jgi:hypothetical protein